MHFDIVSSTLQTDRHTYTPHYIYRHTYTHTHYITLVMMIAP